MRPNFRFSLLEVVVSMFVYATVTIVITYLLVRGFDYFSTVSKEQDEMRELSHAEEILKSTFFGTDVQDVHSLPDGIEWSTPEGTIAFRNSNGFLYKMSDDKRMTIASGVAVTLLENVAGLIRIRFTHEDGMQSDVLLTK